MKCIKPDICIAIEIEWWAHFHSKHKYGLYPVC